MDEPDVGDGGGHQRLHGRHAEALNCSSHSERAERLRCGGPEARHHEPNGRCEVDGSLSDLDGEGVAKETGDGNGCDTGTLQAQGECLQWDSEAFRQRRECRRQERPDGTNASTPIADGYGVHSLPPFWPVVRIVGRVAGLRDENYLSGRVMFEEIGIDACWIFEADMSQLVQR